MVKIVMGDPISTLQGESTHWISNENYEGSPWRKKISVHCALCGSIFCVSLHNILYGRSVACKPCRAKANAKSRHKDLTGQIFGRLTVLAIDGRLYEKLTFRCQCSCGKITEHVAGASLTRGLTQSCGCLKRESVILRSSHLWQPGDIIGQFRIIEQVEGKQNRHYYRVYDAINEQERVMSTQHIMRFSNPLSYIKEIMRVRFRYALKAKKYHKTGSVITGTPWSIDDIVRQVGVKPSRNHHLDHICPLNCATTEEEVILLFNPQNLRWVDAACNLSKSDKKTPDGVRLHMLLLGRPWN